MSRIAMASLLLVCWHTSATFASDAFLVKDIHLGPEGSDLGRLAVVGDRVFFYADDGQHGFELWVSDGTDQGTVLVKDIWPGATGSVPGEWLNPNWLSTSFLTAVGDRLFFIANDGQSGYELWVSDGTEDGTTLVKDINPGPMDSDAWMLAPIGNRLYFQAYDGRSLGLWISDGTKDGTRLFFLKDISVTSLAPLGDRLFFSANDGQLWVSDGTTEGTMIVTVDIPGWVKSWILVGDRLFFIANGSELWVSDGTPERTGPVITDSNIRDLTAVGDRLFFLLAYKDEPLGLWVSDGTPAGTGQVTGFDPSGLSFDGLTAVYDELFLIRGQELWVSNGTAEGTRFLKELVGPTFSGSIALDDRLFFRGFEGDNQLGLWSSDGTAQGTSRIRDLGYFVWPCGWGPECPRARWPEFQMHRDTLVFTAQDDRYGTELWALPLRESAPRFHRADPNASGTTDLSDAIAIFGYLFLGSDTPTCLESADVNNDETIDISDGIAVLNWLFGSGEEPAAPGPAPAACGVDPDPAGSEGNLGCEVYGACQ